MDVIDYDSRLTPYMKPHSSCVVGLHDNPSGDIQFINNLFVNGGDASQYSKALLPVVFDGNVYTKGAVRPIGSKEQKKYGEMNQQAREQMKNYKDQDAKEENALVREEFDADPVLSLKGNEVNLEIALDKNWLTGKRKLVTTSILTKALVPGLRFENPDGSGIRIDTDYTGKKRNPGNPSPGPFEILNSGRQTIRVW